MKSKSLEISLPLISLLTRLTLCGCGQAHGAAAADAPPSVRVVAGLDGSLLTVDNPEQYPLVAAVARSAASDLVVTGAVNPDIARNVLMISLASGRVVPAAPKSFQLIGGTLL